MSFSKVQLLLNSFIYPYLRYLISFKNMLRSIENFGISVVHGINYFASGSLPKDKHLFYVQHDTICNDLLYSILHYIPALQDFYNNIVANMTNYDLVKEWYVCILSLDITSKSSSIIKRGIPNFYLKFLLGF